MENLSGVRVDKLSSHKSSSSVNIGDEITFTFSVFNSNTYPVSLNIYDKVPANTVYVSGGESVTDGELTWTVAVGAGETVTVSYTVKVLEGTADGATVYGTDATVGGVSVKCPEIYVKRTLTAEEQNKIADAAAALMSEGTTLTGLAFVNEVYYRALGTENAFADTNADTVMTGANGAFVTDTTYSAHGHKLNPTGSYYKMLVPHLYGGYNFINISGMSGDRTRLLKEQNLTVGDVIISRTSSALRIFLYVGGDKLINISSTPALDTVSVNVRCSYLLAYYKYYGVLRPSFTFSE
jgi:uncharacterized repeat protein (TIGR01451 family)